MLYPHGRHRSLWPANSQLTLQQYVLYTQYRTVAVPRGQGGTLTVHCAAAERALTLTRDTVTPGQRTELRSILTECCADDDRSTYLVL